MTTPAEFDQLVDKFCPPTPVLVSNIYASCLRSGSSLCEHPLLLYHCLHRLFIRCHHTVTNSISQLPSVGVPRMMVQDIPQPLFGVTSLCQSLTDSPELIHRRSDARRPNNIWSSTDSSCCSHEGSQTQGPIKHTTVQASAANWEQSSPTWGTGHCLN